MVFEIHKTLNIFPNLINGPKSFAANYISDQQSPSRQFVKQWLDNLCSSSCTNNHHVTVDLLD